MSPDKIIITIAGTVLIAFIYWYFLGKKSKEVVVTDSEIDIKVEGGYNPDFITIPVGKTTTVNFTRTDPNGCLEDVVLSDFKIRKKLPLNEKVSIEIKPTKKGEFMFSCGMNMYHGKVKVI